MHTIKDKAYSLLRKSEKIFKTDMVYLASGSFWLFLNQLIQVLSSFAITLVLANTLTRTDFGIFQFIFSSAAVLGTFTLQMTVPVKRAVAKGNDGALQHGFKKQLTWSISITVTACLLSLYYFYNDNSLLGKSYLALGILLPIIGSSSLFKAFLLGKQKFKEVVSLGLALRPLLALVMLITLYFTKDIFIIILIYFITGAASVLSLYIITVKKYSPTYKNDPSIANYAKHISMQGILSVVKNNADKLALFYLLGAPQVAVYAIAIMPVNHILRFMSLFGELILPKFARHDLATIQANVWKKIFLYFSASLLVVIIFYFVSPYFFSILFSEYSDAILLSQVASLSILTKFGAIFSQTFHAHRLIKQQYVMNVSVTIISILLLVLLVPKLGVWGAVTVSIATNVFWVVISGLLFFTKR